MQLQDLTKIHQRYAPDKAFHNFYRSIAYKAARDTLSALPQSKVLVKTRPMKNVPSKTMAHPLIALAFLSWINPDRHSQTLLHLLTRLDTTETPAP